MGKRLRSILGLLAVMIITVSILSGCSKKNDTATSSQEETSASTNAPTTAPTNRPTETPTDSPTAAPTAEPTSTPTVVPATEPTEAHTGEPAEERASPEVTNAIEETAETIALKGISSEEPKEGMFDPWYSVETSIAYSSGTDSDWSYGNQRKEFYYVKPCYVRIGSSIVANWHWGWNYGEGNMITVTYRFTGAEHCKIEMSDGFATEVETGDSNIVKFTRTLIAKGSTEEDVVVFRYTPDQAGSVSLEVIYDNQIKSKFDERNTVYFVNDEW